MIYINGRFLSQRPTGVNRFAYEICRGFVSLNIRFIILAPSDIKRDYDVSMFKIVHIGYLKSHIWEQFFLPFYLLSRIKGSILLSFTGLGPIFMRRHIATIHDLSFLENPLWYSKVYYYFYKLLTPILVQNAKAILTVSEFSKKTILKYYKISQEKITVVYNAVPKSLYPNLKSKVDTSVLSLNQPYFLAVSSLDPRKNFPRLISAFLSINFPNMKLYIIGKKDRVFRDVHSVYENQDSVIYLGYVSDEDLQQYYKNAIAFVYPSLYEGFGIPPLEAMANGCPSVVSDIEVFREVYGNSVIYVNPLETESIADGLQRILDERIRIELMSKVSGVLKNYSWNSSATRIVELLRKLGYIG